MKRPQFSIGLMLLVVTLLATIFAWRHAVWQVERPEKLKSLRQSYALIQDMLLNTPSDPANPARMYAESRSKSFEVQIKDLQASPNE